MEEEKREGEESYMVCQSQDAQSTQGAGVQSGPLITRVTRQAVWELQWQAAGDETNNWLTSMSLQPYLSFLWMMKACVSVCDWNVEACTCTFLYVCVTRLVVGVFSWNEDSQIKSPSLRNHSGAAGFGVAACIIIMGDLNDGELSLRHERLPCTVGRGRIWNILILTGGCEFPPRCF